MYKPCNNTQSAEYNPFNLNDVPGGPYFALYMLEYIYISQSQVGYAKTTPCISFSRRGGHVSLYI